MNSKTFAGFSSNPIQIIVAVAFIAAVLLAGPRNSAEAQVFVQFSDHNRLFKGEVVEGMAVLDGLNAAIRAGNLPLKISTNAVTDSTTVERSDGRAGTVTVYVNSQLIELKKMHHVPLRPGDMVIVKVL